MHCLIKVNVFFNADAKYSCGSYYSSIHFPVAFSGDKLNLIPVKSFIVRPTKRSSVKQVPGKDPALLKQSFTLQGNH